MITFQKSNTNYKRSKHHYCSVSCSCKGQPRRKPEGKCKDCGNNICTKRARCKACDTIYRANRIDNKQLKDTFCPGINRYGCIRSRAKTLYKHLRKNGCQICGYSHHVDICHIKDICKFSKNDLVKNINSPSNIALLCKNCHWELHHDLIKIKIPTIEKWCQKQKT